MKGDEGFDVNMKASCVIQQLPILTIHKFERIPQNLSEKKKLPTTPNALKNYVKNLLGLNLEKWGSIPFRCSVKTLSKAI